MDENATVVGEECRDCMLGVKRDDRRGVDIMRGEEGGEFNEYEWEERGMKKTGRKEWWKGGMRKDEGRIFLR